MRPCERMTMKPIFCIFNFFIRYFRSISSSFSRAFFRGGCVQLRLDPRCAASCVESDPSRYPTVDLKRAMLKTMLTSENGRTFPFDPLLHRIKAGKLTEDHWHTASDRIFHTGQLSCGRARCDTFSLLSEADISAPRFRLRVCVYACERWNERRPFSSTASGSR